MHLVINNVAGIAKVNRVNDFVVTVIFVAIEVGGLTAMSCASQLSLSHENGLSAANTRVVKEERVIGIRVFDQPMHSSNNVYLGRLRHGILLIVCEDDHVFPSIAKVAIEIRGHVLYVIDATPQLPSLAKVVDANQESLSSSSAVGVLEAVSLRCSIAEALHAARRRRGGVVVSLHVGI